MANYVTVTSDKSKKTALLLCIFLGMFGAHQYYVGKIGKGILYTCTFGIFGFGWIIDIFKIALEASAIIPGLHSVSNNQNFD